MPAPPFAMLMPLSILNVAFRPPPRSSTPCKPNSDGIDPASIRENCFPEFSPVALFAVLLVYNNPASTIPYNVTLLCACTKLADSIIVDPATTFHLAYHLFFSILSSLLIDQTWLNFKKYIIWITKYECRTKGWNKRVAQGDLLRGTRKHCDGCVQGIDLAVEDVPDAR